MQAALPPALNGLKAPSLADIDVMASDVFRRLPRRFQDMCQGLVIQVDDFPTEEVLDSMGLDSELCLAWEADGDAELTSDIRDFRAALLAEHSGRSADEFLEVEGLVARIDALSTGPGRRLEPCSFERQSASPLRNQIFDPGDPVELPVLTQS